MFVLRQVAEFFVTHRSNVYMAALDAKKAFDRVHHLKLFNVFYPIVKFLSLLLK